MNYTNIILFLLGVLGMVLHNLVQLNKVNRASNGSINLWKYLRMEIYSILITVIMVFCAIIIKTEITQLEQAGKWLGLSFIAIGYMGQSLLIWLMGKAEKTIGKTDSTVSNSDSQLGDSNG